MRATARRISAGLRSSQRRGDGVEGAPERPGTLGLHRVELGWRGDRTERGRLAQRRGAGARERAAADLDDEVVDGRAGRGELGGDLVAERLSALDGEPVQVPLAREGNRARVDLLEEPVHRRIAGLARRPRAGGDDRPELLEPCEHGRLGIDRNEDAQRALARRGDDGGREGGVAAARDREIGSARGIGQPEPLRDLEIEQHAEEMPGLVRARDVPGLVLDPDAAVAPRSRAASLSSRLARERRDDEAVPVDRRDVPVEPAHDRAELARP